jgi:WD40 repeat protein
MVDQTEENCRMKPKLTRAPVRLDYLPKFLKDSNSRYDDDTTLDLLVEVSSSSKQQAPESPVKKTASEDFSPSLSLAKSDLGPGGLSLYKDLYQYRADNDSQSRSLSKEKQAQEEDDEDDEYADEEEDEYEAALSETADLYGEDHFSLEREDSYSPVPSPKKPDFIPVELINDSEKKLFEAPCEIILPNSNSSTVPSFGNLILTKSRLIFMRTNEDETVSSFYKMLGREKRPESLACDKLWSCSSFPSTQWLTIEICNIFQRYYRLQFVAVEIFTTSRKSFFFNLRDQKIASKFQFTLRKFVKPPYMAAFLGKKPSMIVTRSLAPGSLQPLSLAWANREISNFEYLMHLNTIAGRTYNDLGQYPIFPWILADYTSTELNLKNRKTFRDLKWPIGAQDESQRQIIISKYRDLASLYDPNDDSSLPPFHYGTHYSVAGFVLWYLMRMEPYTSLHVQLQDGRIDRADRLFDSFNAAWRGCSTNPSDAKELIPELFYSPEILYNVNCIDFGKTQGNHRIDNITLPTWAKDPYEFMRKHREALESEYVSRNLHHWIDLVFGYKQRPPYLSGGSDAAVTSCNVFFHLTYENAVDLEKLKQFNEQLYAQYICQIAEFGQTPCQLFTKEHIARQPLSKVEIIWPIASIIKGIHTIYDEDDRFIGMPKSMLCPKEMKISNVPLLFIIEDDDKLMTIDFHRVIGCHSWQTLSSDAVPPFKMKIDPSLTDYNAKPSLFSFGKKSSLSLKEKKIGVPFASSSILKPNIEYNTNDSSSLSTGGKGNGEGVIKVFRSVKISTYEKEEKRYRHSIPVATPTEGMQNNYQGSHQSVPFTSSVPASSSVLATGSAEEEPGNMVEYDTGMRGREASNSIDLSSVVPSTPTALPVVSMGGMLTTATGSRIRTHSGSTAAAGGSGSTKKAINQVLAFAQHNHKYVKYDHISAKNFAYLPEAKVIFSCGHWDWSIRITSTETGKLLQSLTGHNDVVNCLAISKDYGNRWLVTGSRDCTVITWDIQVDPRSNNIASITPIRTLYGHDDAVNCLVVNPEIDMVLSGSDDGTMIFHNLRDGKYIRSVLNTDSAPPKRYHNSSFSSSFDENDHHPSVHAAANSSALMIHSTPKNHPPPTSHLALLYPSIPNEDDNSTLMISSVNTTPSAFPAIRSPSLVFPGEFPSSLGHAAGGGIAQPPSASLQKYHNRITGWKVTWLGVSREGYIITYSAEQQRLTTFSLNGDFIVSKKLSEHLYCFLLSEDGMVLLTGGSSCLVTFRWVRSLSLCELLCF